MNELKSISSLPKYTRLIDLVRDLKSDTKLDIDEIDDFSNNDNILNSDIVEDLSSAHPVFNKNLYSYNDNLEWTTVLQFCNDEENYGYNGRDARYWAWDAVSDMHMTSQFRHYPQLPWVHHIARVDINTAIMYHYDWPWEQIAQYTPVQVVYKYKQLPVFKYISSTPDITIQWIRTHPDCGIVLEHINSAHATEAMKDLSKYININEIINNPDVDWNYAQVSHNRTLTTELILQRPDVAWDWNWIFGNPNISLVDLAKSTDDAIINLRTSFKPTPWHASRIPKAHTLRECSEFYSKEVLHNILVAASKPVDTLQCTVADLQHVGIHDYALYSHCTGLQLHKILQAPHKWNWSVLSANSSFSARDIQYVINLNNPAAQWNWHKLSCNPNLTYDFVWTHRYMPFDWLQLALNKFTFEFERRAAQIRTTITDSTTQISDLSQIILEY